MKFILEPWPWYIAGPLIGLLVPTLLLLGKQLGVSSSFRHACAATLPSNIPFLNYNWKEHSWNLVFVLGIILGGYLGSELLSSSDTISLSEDTKNTLASMNISSEGGYIPEQLFGWEFFTSLKGFLFIVMGGFVIGFGTRYAGGCTSGHAIMGLSNLQLPSLIAVVFFFVGGLAMTHFILPHLF
jgi:uncharacterized membrane protein YedE/YeeE